MTIRKMWQSTAVAVAGVSLLVLAGCSGEDSEDSRVRSVVTGFFSDLADGDGAACDVVTGSATRLASLVAASANAPATCPDAVRVFSGQLSSDEKEALRNAKVNRTTISGDQATIDPNDVEFPLDGRSQFLSSVKAGPTQLVKVDGSWKISSLG